MPARMTATAYVQGMKNALSCALGLVAVVGLTAGAASWLTGRPLYQTVIGAFGVFLVVVFVAFFGSYARDMATRGRLILDCGPHPTRWLFLLNAALFLGLGALGELAGLPRRVSVVLGVVFGLYWVILSTGRLQVRENGLWQYWGLLHWDRVASYRWANDATLILRGRGLLNFLQGALPVPPEHQAELKAELARHAPADDLA
jgi:hypothetical protein